MIKKSLPKKIGRKKKESDTTKIKKRQQSYMIRKADLEKLPEIDRKIKDMQATEEWMIRVDFVEKAKENNVVWEQSEAGTMSLLSEKTGKHIVFFCDKHTPSKYKMFKLKQLLGEFD